MYQVIAILAQQDGNKPAPSLFSDPMLPIVLLVMMVAFYFIVMRPRALREKKEREDLLSKMKKNDEVLTAAGIIGIVAQVKDDEVVLKVDESSNVRLRVLKSAIVRVLNPKEPPKDAAAPAADNVKAGTPPAK
jgi:preprotein translocase subunit YajC